MNQDPQQQPRQWKGMERRQSLGEHQGEERRKTHGIAQVGYRGEDSGTPGVNAEEPTDEQEERQLQQARGPNR